MLKALLVPVGLALVLATPLTAQADDWRSSTSPMARDWSSAMPASDQIFGPSLGPSAMGRDRTRVKNRHRRHEQAPSAMSWSSDAAATWNPAAVRGKRGANHGAKATGWGTGAAGGLAGGHNP
jgi:hypothetical protein